MDFNSKFSLLLVVQRLSVMAGQKVNESVIGFVLYSPILNG